MRDFLIMWVCLALIGGAVSYGLRDSGAALERCENAAYRVQVARSALNDDAYRDAASYALRRDVIESQLQLNLEVCRAANR